MSGTFQCMHCLGDTVVWDNDYDFSDLGYEGKGIVHICHCTNCGAEVEYRVPYKEEPTIHTHCLRCGKKLRSQESQILGYGKTCGKKMRGCHLQLLKLF